MSSIDVIVPCYRYGCFLDQCVGSVLEQPGVDVRVLIIDDASPDDSFDVAMRLANRDSRVLARRHEFNRGHIATYNEGIDWASADYLLLLSADDLVTPGSLERAVRFMSTNPDIGFVHGRAMRLEHSDSAPPPQLTIPDATDQWVKIAGLDFVRTTGAVNPVLTPTAVVRTALQKKLGGYRPELPHAGDLEMWWRFAAHAAVGVTQDYQAVYRTHGRNMHLGYLSLRDFDQRRIAIDTFVSACGDVLPEPIQLRDWLKASLAEEAVSSASAAFNRGQSKVVREFSEFALSLYPGVRTTRKWRNLSMKRLVGSRIWSAVAPVADLIRDGRRRLVGK